MMADVTTKKCDGTGCGKLRVNDTNHWLQGAARGLGIFIGVLDGRVPEEFDGSSMKHFCGQRCASSWFMDEVGKLKGDE